MFTDRLVCLHLFQFGAPPRSTPRFFKKNYIILRRHDKRGFRNRQFPIRDKMPFFGRIFFNDTPRSRSQTAKFQSHFFLIFFLYNRKCGLFTHGKRTTNAKTPEIFSFREQQGERKRLASPIRKLISFA